MEISFPILPKLKSHFTRGNGKIPELKGVDGCKDVLQTQQDNFTYELTVAMIICIRSAQNQGIQGPHGVGNCQKVSSLSEELLAIDGCWQRES